jgi:putative spermidine/putrescine transport system substrate-binding protein
MGSSKEGLMTCRTQSIARRSFMREMTAGAAAAALSPMIATPAAIAADQIPLTICSYGGVYQEAQDKAYFKPYAQANPNIRILQESPESNAKLVAMVESGNVTWDLAICSPDFGMDDDAKWLEPIDYSIIDKSQFSDGFASNYRLGSDVEAMLMAYRKDKLKEPPQRFADFFDLKGFPGRRLAYKNLHSGILEIALLVDGVSPSQLYPIDVQRALNKLSTIKNNLIWWQTGAQSVEYMVSGEAVIGLLWNGRAVSAGESAPVALAWGEWFHTDAYWVVPKGAPHKQAAMEALKYFTSPEAQASFTSYLPYGPTNKLAIGKVSDKYRFALATEHESTGIRLDYAWWNKNLHTVDPVFQAWLLS